MSDCEHDWVEQPDRGHTSVYCRRCYRSPPSHLSTLRALAAAEAVVQRLRDEQRRRWCKGPHGVEFTRPYPGCDCVHCVPEHVPDVEREGW